MQKDHTLITVCSCKTMKSVHLKSLVEYKNTELLVTQNALKVSVFKIKCGSWTLFCIQKESDEEETHINKMTSMALANKTFSFIKKISKSVSKKQQTNKNKIKACIEDMVKFLLKNTSLGQNTAIYNISFIEIEIMPLPHFHCKFV